MHRGHAERNPGDVADDISAGEGDDGDLLANAAHRQQSIVVAIASIMVAATGVAQECAYESRLGESERRPSVAMPDQGRVISFEELTDVHSISFFPGNTLRCSRATGIRTSSAGDPGQLGLRETAVTAASVWLRTTSDSGKLSTVEPL